MPTSASIGKFSGPVDKPDALRFGPLTGSCVHICVDMQLMFYEKTGWHMPWMERVLPVITELVTAQPAHTIFTRFVPAQEPGQGSGMWRSYYKRGACMTIAELGREKVDLVPELARFAPPAKLLDKYVYSPWLGSGLHQQLHTAGIDTIVITGGETDVCVQATVMGAIDWGFRTVLVTDAVCSSSDEAHDALMEFYRGRLGEQLEIASCATVLRNWQAA